MRILSLSQSLSQSLSLPLSLLLAVAATAQEPSLPAEIASLIEKAPFAQAHWGIYAEDLETGKPLLSRNQQKLFRPASTTKLFSCAAALEAFGATFRFETPIYKRGSWSKDKHWQGDLILRASGDLTLGGRTTESGTIAFTNSDHIYSNGGTKTKLTSPAPLAGLERLAQQVKAHGIDLLEGDVLVDARLFDPAYSSGSGPRRVSPIVINDNLFDFTLSPTEKGEPAKLAWRPQTESFRVDSEVTTSPEGSESHLWIDRVGDRHVVVRGAIPMGSAPRILTREVSKPGDHARLLLLEALARAGVEVKLEEREAKLPELDAYAKLESIAHLRSPMFGENLKLILKVSHNLHASTLPLLMAAQIGQHTLEEGLRRQGALLSRMGIDTEKISFGGAAGGSRSDLTTPAVTVQLLRAMSMRHDFDVYRGALPRLGVDGTLAKVVDAKSPALGKVQAKTGTYWVWDGLNGRGMLTSKALAGYMTTKSGREIAFALMVNSVPMSDSVRAETVGRVLGRLSELIYDRY